MVVVVEAVEVVADVVVDVVVVVVAATWHVVWATPKAFTDGEQTNGATQPQS